MNNLKLANLVEKLPQKRTAVKDLVITTYTLEDGIFEGIIKDVKTLNNGNFEISILVNEVNEVFKVRFSSDSLNGYQAVWLDYFNLVGAAYVEDITGQKISFEILNQQSSNTGTWYSNVVEIKKI